MGPGEEEGQTIRDIMHIHCLKKKCASVILGEIGKGPGGLRQEQASPRVGLMATIKETSELVLERWDKIWAVEGWWR